jgi:Isochorismatase family
LPIIVITTARNSMWGPTFRKLVEALPGVPIIDRSSVNAFDDPEVAQAINATGRTKLIFAGISLEVCAAFSVITAVGKGLDAYVALDPCGTFSETKRQVGLLRMLQAGVILSDYTTLMVEILKDNARAEATAVYGAMDMPWAKLVGRSLRRSRAPELRLCNDRGHSTREYRDQAHSRYAGRIARDPRLQSLHRRQPPRADDWLVVDEASERRQLASRSMIGQRAPIREPDVCCQIGENLSRQPQKAGALDLLSPTAETPRQGAAADSTA